MRSKNLLAASCAVALSGFGTVATAADVVIGVPNWPSVLATAHVLKVAMENNLGLEVELQNGTNPVVFEAMDSGSMHVHPEVWLPNQTNLNNQYVQEKSGSGRGRGTEREHRVLLLHTAPHVRAA